MRRPRSPRRPRIHERPANGVDGELRMEGVRARAMWRSASARPATCTRARRSSRRFASSTRASRRVDHLVCYAVKANSNLAVLDVLARLGAGFDIVSGRRARARARRGRGGLARDLLRRGQVGGGDPRRARRRHQVLQRRKRAGARAPRRAGRRHGRGARRCPCASTRTSTRARIPTYPPAWRATSSASRTTRALEAYRHAARLANLRVDGHRLPHRLADPRDRPARRGARARDRPRGRPCARGDRARARGPGRRPRHPLSRRDAARHPRLLRAARRVASRAAGCRCCSSPGARSWATPACCSPASSTSSSTRRSASRWSTPR